MALRRQFDLLPADRQFLDEYGLPWETVIDGAQQWVLIQEFPTHDGYNNPRVTAAIRMETGYPNTELNMVYFSPALARKDRREIAAISVTQALDGKSYQRWSRHRTARNPWKIGRDNIGTHIFLIEDWLAREFEKCPLP
jgi:Prokaryotic E2 family E